MKVRFVKQEARCGCSIACMAMVLNKSYAEIAKDFGNDFIDNGQPLDKSLDYLADAGFQIIAKEVKFWNNINFSRKEMLKPFAPVHLVRVLPRFDSENGHLVVMDKRGKLICPDGASERETLNSYAITDVIGLYK